VHGDSVEVQFVMRPAGIINRFTTVSVPPIFGLP
jgi:hypothetical protein